LLNLVWSFCRFFVKLLFKPCFFRLFCEILGNCHFYFFKLQTKSNLLSETLIIENRSIFFFFFHFLCFIFFFFSLILYFLIKLLFFIFLFFFFLSIRITTDIIILCVTYILFRMYSPRRYECNNMNCHI